MRGILECWVKQSARVEAFKTRQSAAHALHVKFHLTTGEPVLTDQQYHHLQIDVISLYLLFLVQMITSGLQIIYTQVWIRSLCAYGEEGIGKKLTTMQKRPLDLESNKWQFNWKI